MSGPIATRHSDGSVTLEWPDGKPGVFDMSTVTFERMIEDANAERALCDDLADVAKEAIRMVSIGGTLYGFDNREAWLERANEVFARWQEARK